MAVVTIVAADGRDCGSLSNDGSIWSSVGEC